MRADNLSSNKEGWSVWISLGAFVISGLAVLFSYKQFNTTKDLSERNQFRELVIKIAEERDRSIKDSPCHTTFKPVYRTVKQTNKVEVLVQELKYTSCANHISRSVTEAPISFSADLAIVYFHEARDIEPSIEHMVTPTEYLILADIAFAHSGVNSANEYAEKALRCAKDKGDSTSIIFVLQSLGDMKYKNFPLTSINEGREHYQEAVDTSNALSSKNKSQFVEAGLWLSWAIAEASVGAIDNAERYFEEAEEKIKQSTFDDVSRQKWILNGKTELIEVAQKHGQLPAKWRNKEDGHWVEVGPRVKFDKVQDLFVPEPDPNVGGSVPPPREVQSTSPPPTFEETVPFGTTPIPGRAPKTYEDPPKTFADEPVNDSGFGEKKH